MKKTHRQPATCLSSNADRENLLFVCLYNEIHGCDERRRALID